MLTNMINAYLETKKEDSTMNTDTDTTTDSTTANATKDRLVKGAVKNIRWGAPPPVVTTPKKAKRGYDLLMDRVRANAGQWGLVSRNVNVQTVYYLRNRYPDLKFEWRGTRASCKVWAIKPVEVVEEASDEQAPTAGQTDLTS